MFFRHNTLTTFYAIPGIGNLILHDENGNAHLVRRHLQHFQVADSSKDALEIYLCRQRNFPAGCKNSSSGTHKGIPWKLAFEQESDGKTSKFFFWAPCFQNVLVLAYLIIPCLKYASLHQHGFLAYCSAFMHQATTYLLFGESFCNKTSLTLKALEHHATLLGDDGIFISSNEITGRVSNTIAVRYNTIRHTTFWNQLKLGQKFALQVFHAMSSKYLSYCLYLRFDDLGVRMPDDFPINNHIIAIQLCHDATFTSITPDEMAEELLINEDWYHSKFGSILTERIHSDRTRLQEIMIQFFLHCSNYRMPSHCSIDEILALSPR